MSVLLKVEDLRVALPTETGTAHVINGVDIKLKRSEIIAILGESGSGKSVTLRTLLRLLPSKARVSGKVTIEGRDIMSLSDQEMSDLRGPVVSMIFQEPMSAFDPVFTVGRQITETIRRHEGCSEAVASKRALDLFERVQIPSAKRRLSNYPFEMSGGMRQRAMIALALACRPSLLLADEPTTALDATVQIQILLLIKELQKELGMGVMFVTHDIGVAVEIGDRIAVMYAGRFVETGSVRDVFARPAHPYTRGLMASTVRGYIRGTRMETIGGSPPDPTRLPPGCAFAPRCREAEPACYEALPLPRRIDTDHEASCIHVRSAQFETA